MDKYKERITNKEFVIFLYVGIIMEKNLLVYF